MIIYKTTNLVNGKIYIGYDTKNNPEYFGSGKIYRQAEQKYGKENFRKTTIDSDKNFKSLCLKEIFWIDALDARNPKVGYNIHPGGKGSESGENNPIHGMRCSEETKKKMSIAHTGKKLSDETKRKIGKSNAIVLIGKRLSAEHKKKIGMSICGEKHPLYGTHRSDKTKEKIRQKAIGENNPMSKTNREKRRLRENK